MSQPQSPPPNPIPPPGWSVQGQNREPAYAPPWPSNPPGPPPPPPARRGRKIVVTAAIAAVSLVVGILIGDGIGKGGTSGAGSDSAAPTTVTVTAGAATTRSATLRAVAAPSVTKAVLPKPTTSATTSAAAVRANTSARLTVLGAGTFTVGVDVPPGRYVITPKPGESGNISASTQDDPVAIDEILGKTLDGVPSVTATLTKGESVQISGLSQVTFTPAKTRLATTLSTGEWRVGLDIRPGRYVAAPASGESGNFTVYDTDGFPAVDEILGKAADGVPNVTVTLTNGEEIDISGIATVAFTAH